MANTKLALCFEYDGTHFRGWQAQNNPPVRSVEEELNHAVSVIANHPVKMICAGRTDAGVHADNQIAHFETPSIRKPHAWLFGINSHLPDDVAVKWIGSVSDDFHSRHSALDRLYRYQIYNSPYRSALTRYHQTWIHYDLDIEAMQEAAHYLIGEHDFSAFRSSECQSHSTHRNVHYINIERHDLTIQIDIKANAFLHHMVRNIVGTLLEVGKGKEDPLYLKRVLESRDRTLGGINAPPQGLYLRHVTYPDHFNIPNFLEDKC